MNRQIATILANYTAGEFALKASGPYGHTTTFSDGVFEFTRFDGGDGENRGRWEIYVILQSGRDRGLPMFQGYCSPEQCARLDAAVAYANARKSVESRGHGKISDIISNRGWSIDMATGRMVG